FLSGALAYVTHIWSRAFDNYGECRAIALDISNAFDRVWHDGLLNKPAFFGLPASLCSWLASFLKNRSLHVGHISCRA
ncbi:MAG: hypothetical protein KTM48_03825, partial [Wolbachia endosymbiont of Pissodes strobi]|nr:hypothetical protein [Wolbachia endosymbiont of Pissodes strobi]